MRSNTEPKPLLDAAFGVVLIGLMVAALQDGFLFGEFVAGWPAIFLGLYVQAWGILFLLSYRFSRHSYLLKFLMWLCEHHSNPRGAWTALLWGGLAIGTGFMPLLIGLGLASF